MHKILALLLAGAVAACGGDSGSTGDSGAARSSGSVDLTGAGATFPYPLYSRWFSDYAAQTGVRINYQSIGSGGGIRQLGEQTVDFGASDGPMTDAELANAKGGAVLHVPTVLGADVMAYNLPGVTQPIKLDGATIADIYLGRITKWNDARIVGLNPGVSIPATDILVVHRSDGSGTTYIFTDYLATVSPAWASGPGRGKEVRWPVGLGAKGNEGVSAQVKQLPGAIGYVEMAYANQNRLQVAQVRNKAGRFITPSPASITAAAEGAMSQMGPGSDYRVSIVDADGPDAYPISSFTWLLVYAQPRDTVKGRKLAEFLQWALTTGQTSAESLDYAPLPAALAQQLLGEVKGMPGTRAP
ncbi:MAG: phosphate ABC transporter substrate-binding protein PstS [Gemmatimonadaceae bacterium]|nr:phosphate ABC transporter substrate-binding protein PstS [Gemmatimonadaceae bacterium]